MTPPQVFTIRQAATWAGVDPRTIRRRLAAGAFPNALRDGTTATAAWLVPLADLEAAGLRAAGIGAAVEVVMPDPTEGLRAENDDLRRALLEERAARAVDAATIRELRDRVEVADRRVEAADRHAAELTENVRLALAAPSTPEPRRRWWQRSTP